MNSSTASDGPLIRSSGPNVGTVPGRFDPAQIEWVQKIDTLAALAGKVASISLKRGAWAGAAQAKTVNGSFEAAKDTEIIVYTAHAACLTR